MRAGEGDFYVTGGTVGLDAESYVPRAADQILFNALERGEFCYVLTSRQMGKSSLSVRIADQLRSGGAFVARLDLTAVGQNLEARQWYDGLLDQLGGELGLEAQVEAFWRTHEHLPPLLRWMQGIKDVVLKLCDGPVVIFVDEIDYVRSLPFSTDEFFAAIRECYNRRTADKELRRLTFCLLGVASPSDLIKDTRTTPFNIGLRIDLTDFSPAEAGPLATGLGREPQTADRLLARILYWTNGHPYLTQRLCRAVAEDRNISDASGVDRLCEEMFLSNRARERDDNLLFVRERLLRSDTGGRAALLELYDNVLRSRTVRDDEADPRVETLRLSGITRAVGGYLEVRNRIYRAVFDRAWISSSRPEAYRAAFRRGAWRAGAIACLVSLAVAGMVYYWLDRYVIENISYYNTWTKIHGMPWGIGPIKPAAVRHRTMTFKFFRTGRSGPVTKVQAIGSDGQLTTAHGWVTYLDFGASDDSKSPNSRSCQWEFIRDHDGRVVYEIGRDRSRRMVWGFVYSPAGSDEVAIAHFVDERGFPQSPAGSYADYVEIRRSPLGWESSLRFFGRNGKPQVSRGQLYGEARIYTAAGVLESVTDLGADGKPVIDREGYAKTWSKHDPSGNATEYSYLDLEDRPTVSNAGVARVTKVYDSFGNEIERRFWGLDGRPALHARGWAAQIVKRDDRGNQVETTFLDEAGQPVLIDNHYAGWRARYDDHGNQIEITYVGTAGRPIKTNNSYARARFKYDADARVVEAAYFDELDRPVADKNNCARWTVAYNTRWQRTHEAFFGPDGRPARYSDGYFAWTTQYDDRGNAVESTYFGADGRPQANNEGYAVRRATYDDRGNATRVQLLGRKP